MADVVSVQVVVARRGVRLLPDAEIARVDVDHLVAAASRLPVPLVDVAADDVLRPVPPSESELVESLQRRPFLVKIRRWC